MKWLDKFAESIDHFAGQAAMKEVMMGSEDTVKSDVINRFRSIP